MSDPNQHPNHDPALQHAAEHASPGRRSPVLLYLVILFAIAFLLMLMAYFMQQRTNEQTQNDLNEQTQSYQSAVATLDSILAENEELKEQVEALQKAQDESSDQNQQLTETQDALPSPRPSWTRSPSSTRSAAFITAANTASAAPCWPSGRRKPPARFWRV